MDNKMKVFEIDVGSQCHEDYKKIIEKCKCFPRDSNLGSLAQISIFIHKSYVNYMFKNNATYLDRNRDLVIHTRYISLVPNNFRKI